MKKLFLVITLLGSFLMGCEEIPPEINPIEPQGPCSAATSELVADQQRQVLIEEFTGVRCVNCPAGSKVIKDLLEIYGERLVVVSIHAGFFANPYEESSYDFRTDEGDGLIDLVGRPVGYPSAVINRKLFDGEFDLQLGKNLWPGFIENEMEETPKVKIHISKSYVPADLRLDLEVTIFPQQDFENDDLRLTALLVENDVADVQLTPDGIRPQYVHQHVLRAAITNYDGNPLPTVIAPEDKLCLALTTSLSDTWKIENCSIVAFVSSGGTHKVVWQAHQIPVID